MIFYPRFNLCWDIAVLKKCTNLVIFHKRNKFSRKSSAVWFSSSDERFKFQINSAAKKKWYKNLFSIHAQYRVPLIALWTTILREFGMRIKFIDSRQCFHFIFKHWFKLFNINCKSYIYVIFNKCEYWIFFCNMTVVFISREESIPIFIQNVKISRENEVHKPRTMKMSPCYKIARNIHRILPGREYLWNMSPATLIELET